MNLRCTVGAHPWDANHCPRCGKDNPHPKQPRTAMIGDQVWMAEDLTVVHFRNGDPIPEATSSANFLEAGKKGLPAWHRTISGGGHVRRYNWFAINDERGLAPSGWRVSSVEDFEVLFRAVDRQDLIRSDQGGSNASRFSGQIILAYWTSTRRWFNPPTAFSFALRGSGDAITKTTEDQCEGCLVRCVREGEAHPAKRSPGPRMKRDT